MEKLIFTNKNGESIEIGDRAPFLLTKIEGTGGTNTIVHTQKSPNQHGSTYLNTTLENRSLSLELVVLGENEEDIFKKRNELCRVFNPLLGEGVLKYTFDGGEREINVAIEHGPVFSDEENSPIEQLPCLIQLLSSKPFWRSTKQYREEIAVWLGDFSFELEIPEAGIEMGHREPSLIMDILNKGDVECGMRIEFKALATVENPSIFNVDTREFIKLNKILRGGEVLTVTTHFGNKRVESTLNGVTKNAFKYINWESTFLGLSPGHNYIRYNADEGLDNLEVRILYRPQYLGV